MSVLTDRVSITTTKEIKMSSTATCPTCKRTGEWRASAKGYQYMVTLVKNGRFTNRITHKHEGKMVWRPRSEYVNVREAKGLHLISDHPGARLWSDVKQEVAAMRIHAGTFIGPLLRLEDCAHVIVHHGGSIRTCLRCGHSLVG